MSQVANQYKAVVDISGSTTTGLLSADFGFDANYVRVANDGTVSLRLSLNSSVASTLDTELKPGEVIEWRQSGLTHVAGLATTSTSTETGDYKRARVLALGV